MPDQSVCPSRPCDTNLRLGGQSECCGSDIWERSSLNEAGDGFRCAIWSLPAGPAVNHRGHSFGTSAVPAPLVVVVREVVQQLAEVIQASDDWDASKPFLLESQNGSFCYRDGPVSTHCSEALSDMPLAQQLAERITEKDTLLIADDMLGWPLPHKRLLQCLHHPAGVRTFQVAGGDPQCPGTHYWTQTCPSQPSEAC